MSAVWVTAINCPNHSIMPKPHAMVLAKRRKVFFRSTEVPINKYLKSFWKFFFTYLNFFLEVTHLTSAGMLKK